MTKRTAARAKSPGNKKRRTGDKEDEDQDQPLPQVEKRPTTPGKETWKEVLTPAAKEKASRGAAKKQAPRARGRGTAVASTGASQAPQVQELRIESVPTESSRARSRSRDTRGGGTAPSKSDDSEGPKRLKHWVVVVFAFLVAMGVLKMYNARTHQIAAPVVKEAKKAFGGFLSFRPFFRPSYREGAKQLPAPTTAAPQSPVKEVDPRKRDQEAAKKKAAEAREQAARAKREREEEQRKQARIHKDQMMKEKATAAEKLRVEKEKREKDAARAKEKAAAKKKEEEEAEEKVRKAREEEAAAKKKKEEEEKKKEKERVQKEKEEEERRAAAEREKFEKGVATEKARVLKAQQEAREREEAEEKKRQAQQAAALQAAADAAKETGDAAELEKLRKMEVLKEKQKAKESNKMLTMGGDYSHHEHDVAGLWRGARVVTDDRAVHDIQLTSPWKHHEHSIFAPALAWIRHTAPPVNKLYSAEHPPKDYYSFSGPTGTITIAFYAQMQLREVRLYHPFSDAQRAPKDFRILGWEQNPANRRIKQLEPVVLGHFRYTPDERREMQYFELMRHKHKLSFAAITMEVSSNYHHDMTPQDVDSTEQENWTNLWRVQVIGTEASQLAIA